MFKLLLTIKGNARACLFTEPLWGIPFNLYTPFVILYMYHLGVLDAGIGIILAVGRLVQMVMAIAGGIITDKYGRRLTTLVADIISWSIPMLIWAFSQNFWWFLTAAIVNGIWQITAVSWECLWIDDLEESKIGPVFNWMYITGMMAVFFAPIAGYFVQIYGVVPVVRVLYLFSFTSMTIKTVVLYIYSVETDRGLERMAATKNIPVKKLLLGYKDVFWQLMKSKNMMYALTLQTILSITMLITTTFFALYATQNLNIPAAFMGYFPILRAGVMLAFLLFIQERLNRFKPKNLMMLGITVYIAAMGWLLASPIDNWIWLGIYVIIEACAAALMFPRVDAIAANAIAPKERARLRSLFNMVIMAVSSPFAILAGFLSDINRQLPFILNITLFMIMAAAVLFIQQKREKIRV